MSQNIVKSARLCLIREASKPNPRLDRSDIATLSDQQSIFEAMSTTDFPVLLADTARKKMLDSYKMEAGPLQKLMGTELVSDFEDHSGIRMTQMGNLAEIEGELTEGATYTSIGEEGKTYRVRMFMRRFKLTMKALHTDKLGRLAKLADNWGEIAADSLEQRLVIPFNQNLEQDGTTAVFSAARGNAGVLAFSQANLEATIALLRQMTYNDAEGNARRIKCNSIMLFVPPELELQAKQIYATTEVVPAAAAGGAVYDPKAVWREYGLQPPITIPDLTDANRWFVINASRPWIKQVKHSDAKVPLLLQKLPYWDKNVLGYPVDESMCAEWACAYMYDYFVEDFRTMIAQDSDNPW